MTKHHKQITIIYSMNCINNETYFSSLLSIFDIVLGGKTDMVIVQKHITIEIKSPLAGVSKNVNVRMILLQAST